MIVSRCVKFHSTARPVKEKVNKRCLWNIYAPLGAMLLVGYGHLNKTGMDNQKTFFQLMITLTLTFDPLNSKSIGFICWSWQTCLPSMKSLRLRVLKVLTGNCFFQLKVTLTLTFDPLTSKLIGLICWLWPISISSMRSLSQSVLKLLIGDCFSYKANILFSKKGR